MPLQLTWHSQLESYKNEKLVLHSYVDAIWWLFCASLGTTGWTDIFISKGPGYTDFGAKETCVFGLRNGSLYAWGSNTGGCLGLGDTVNRSSPTLVGSGYTKVVCNRIR